MESLVCVCVCVCVCVSGKGCLSGRVLRGSMYVGEALCVSVFVLSVPI